MSRDEGLIQVKVHRKRVEALNICSFELVSADGRPLPSFAAGAHIDVHVPNGMTRQYSLCNDPMEQSRYLIAVLKDPASRGGSVAMHDMVEQGDELAISAPKNHFALAQRARTSLLFAGGIGITPILSMAMRLSALGEPFALHYCARSQQGMAFRQRIERSGFGLHANFHLDDGPSAQKMDIGNLIGVAEPDTHLYVCGPKGFMDAVLGTARSAGWPESHLHHEFFGAEVVNAEDDAAFEIKLASSGKVIRVQRHQTAVQALAAAGVEVTVSCEQGVCGTCLTRVLDGQCDHRDMYLTQDEHARNDQFAPCVSRSRSALLVLDL